MKFVQSSLAALTIALFSATAAEAQEAQQQTETLAESVAEGDRTDDSYAMGTGNDSGTSTISQKEIDARTPGSGDVNQLLKVLPTVQFNRTEGLASREDIQDIRPANISISGGRIYDNLVTLDGLDVNSRLDTTNTNPQHFMEPAGGSPQTLWLDANLIGQVTLRVSNVAAEFGRFTGGVLNIDTRAPNRRWGISATVNYTADELVDFKVSQASIDAIGANDFPDKPSFQKWRFGVSLDAPLGQNGGLLLAANRSRADVTYFKPDNYGGAPFGQSSLSDNFLAKVDYDLSPTLTLNAQATYTPYESESSAANGVDNTVTSKGGGYAGKLHLIGSGDLRWDLAASYSHNDTSRDASPINYSIPSTTTNGAVCTSTNCTIGGFGDVDQTQDSFGLTLKAAKDLGPGELSGGVDYQNIAILRERPEDGFAYSRGQTGTNIQCAAGNSLTCVTGEYALEQYSRYAAYIADINIDSVSAWAQYDVTFGPIDLRAGVRYDYESFLGNHNFAPRLSATYNLPMEGWQVTLGANRYYGRSMVAYAIREQYPDNFIYRRTGTLTGGQRVYSENWTLNSTSVSTSYDRSELRTPYSDELTGAVSAPVLGGTLRVKGIARWGKDEFARSEQFTEPYTLSNGTVTARRLYNLTNDGESSYAGGSLEWVRTFGKHSVAVNVNYSKTKTNHADYLTSTDDLEAEATQVLFNGEVIPLIELLEQNQRLEYASPFLVNLSWTGLWFDDRLTTNVNVRYRDGFEQLEDTGLNETVNGTRYDVYEIVKYGDNIDVNLNASLVALRGDKGSLTLDMRVSNLSNTIPSKDSAAISQPYQYGRSVWFGASYKF